MSLIGSLEDLSLGDILQIISLSQKSGVLVLRTDSGEGRMLFRAGLVCGATLKDGPSDLRSLLIGAGSVTEKAYEHAMRVGQSVPGGVQEALVAAGHIAGDELAALQRSAVEDAVIRMFRWRSGEFSFDVREEPEPEDPPVFAPIGINAQYLAMEGARVDDEQGRDAAAAPAADPFGAPLPGARMEVVASPEDEDPFGEPHSDPLADESGDRSATAGDLPEDWLDAPAPTPDAASPTEAREEELPLLDPAAVESLVEATMTSVADADVLDEDARVSGSVAADAEPLLEARMLEAPADDDGALGAAEDIPAEPIAVERVAEKPAAVEEALRELPAAVVIDEDLLALEWAKEALQGEFDTVHIFQRQDLGLARIRQYLARAQTPCVLISSEVAGDPLSGITDGADFVRRLKQQAPTMPVLWLGQYGAPLPELGAADAAVRRPAEAELRDARAEVRRQESAAVLRSELRGLLGSAGATGVGTGATDSGVALDELRSTTERLRDASSRGEVLPLVLDFAHERFARVALFMVRDECVVGMVARGPGVDEAAIQGVELGLADSAWFSRVLEAGTLVQAPPSNAGDQCVAAALGGNAPAEATVAPIESGGSIVALLYGDGPAGHGLDTAALEVVLHHAGLALDRAALERALNLA